MAESGGDDRTLRIRFIGDVSDPHAALDRLEQRAGRGMDYGGSGAPGGSVAADPHGVITNDSIPTSAGGAAGGSRSGGMMDAIERAHQRERRAAERAADAEERRAKTMEGALVRPWRGAGGLGGLSPVGPGGGVQMIFPGAGGGLPAGGGGGGTPQIVPGTPQQPQQLPPSPQNPPQPQPQPSPQPGGGGGNSWGRLGNAGRLGRLVTGGYIASELLQQLAAAQEYQNSTILAGRDQGAALAATQQYASQVRRLPIVGQVAGMIVDPTGAQNAMMSNTLARAENQDALTGLQRDAGDARLNISRSASASQFTGSRRALENAQNTYDASLKEGRDRQNSITQSKIGDLDKQRVQANLEYESKQVLFGMIHPSNEKDIRATLTNKLRAIDVQRGQVIESGKRDQSAENENNRIIFESTKREIKFGLGQESLSYQNEAMNEAEIGIARREGLNVRAVGLNAFDRETRERYASIKHDSGQEQADEFDTARKEKRGNIEYEDERDLGVKMAGLAGQTQAARLGAGRNSFGASMATQWAQFGINQVNSRDQGEGVQKATAERDIAQMARTVSEAMRDLSAQVRGNVGGIAVNRLLLGGDERGAGIKSLENQRDNEMAAAGGGPIGFLKRLGIGAKSWSDINLFKADFDLKDKYSVQRLESNRDIEQLRSQGKEKSAQGKGIADSAITESQEILERAKKIDRTAEGGESAYARAQKRARLTLETGLYQEQNYKRELELQMMGRPESGERYGKGGIGGGSANGRLGQERLSEGIKAVKDEIAKLNNALLGVQ